MIQITEFWNKVVDDETAPSRKRVLPGEYEIKNQYRVDGDLPDLKRRYKKHPRMTIAGDMITEDCGRSYGIHSYKEIRQLPGERVVTHPTTGSKHTVWA